MQQLQRIVDGVADIGALLAAILVGGVTASYVVEVVFRYVLDAPLNWAADIGSYALCCIIFLTLPKVTRSRAHVSISFLVDIAPPAFRKLYMPLLMFMSFAVCAIVSVFIGDIAIAQFESGVLTPMANQVPRWWLTATMFYGLAVSALIMIIPGKTVR